MSRAVSVRFRVATAAQETGEVYVMLVTIAHPDLETPIRLSTDPTIRLSTDPLTYGTISRGHSYDYVLISPAIPSDQAGAPARSGLVLANVDADMGAVARSFTTPADVTLEVVTAAEPDFVEGRWIKLKTRRVVVSATQVSVEISRQDLWDTPCPMDRLTANRFPALHR